MTDRHLRFLFVSKDVLAARAAAPVAVILRELGHEVQSIVEGKAAEQFESRHLPIYFKGTESIGSEHFMVDAWNVLARIRPDFVVVTYGSPINLEQEFGMAANVRKTPVIGIEDYWACHRRTRARTDCVLSIDVFGEGLVREALPNARVYVTGNPALPAPVSLAVKEQVDALRDTFEHVFVYTDSGPEAAEEQLQLLIGSLQRSSLNYCLIPRFHPKWKDQHPRGVAATYGKLWAKKLDPIRERVRAVAADRSDLLIPWVDGVFSGSSSLLTTAAYHGKTAVSLLTPKTVTHIAHETGGHEHAPLVELGCAQELTEPTDIAAILQPPREENRKKLFPYNPLKAVEAVLDYVSRR